MSVPDYQTLMRPLLAGFDDGEEHRISDVRDQIADDFALSDEDLAAEIPSGRDKTFRNRIGWATTYVFRAGLLERTSRSVYRITDRGRSVLADNPDRVDVKVLAEFKDFNNFRAPSAALSTVTAAEELVASDGETPEERIAKAAEELRAALSAELLDRVLEQSPEFFEQLVLDVLSAMGYGGGHAGAAERLGQTSDGGVDGVIYEDELGLDLIFVQAKRWKLDSTVGRPEIQKFVGALHGQGATKGVFITTSTFTKEAREYAEGVASRVILLEGRELANRMIDNDVGVAERGAFHLKRADLDYFHGSDD